MVAKLEIIWKELIKPSIPTPHDSKVHKLSFIDQLNSEYYIPVIFFYQNHQDLVPSSSSSCSRGTNIVDRQDVKRSSSQLLKQSLSEALAIFYPLAGRINGNLFVDCNDSGALFVEAQVHSRLSKEALIPIHELSQYMPFEPHQTNSIGNVTLAIQYNSFECGGAAIGVCISHKVADFMSLMTFLATWAAKTRSINNKEEEIEIAASPPPPCFHFTSHRFPPITEEIPSPPHSVQSEKTAKLITKRFVFDKEKIAALKAEITNSYPNPSRVEAVSAFLWKHFIGSAVSESESESSKTIKKTSFVALHLVNLRSRMMNLLPSDRFAFGNLVSVAAAFLKLSDNEDDREYHNLVQLLRTAIHKIDGDHINNLQNGSQYTSGMSKGIEKFSKQEEISKCVFTSWCKFPIYQVDYGWGKPISVCSLVPIQENNVILMPTRCGEGIEAWVNFLENETAVQLPDELLSLATDDLI